MTAATLAAAPARVAVAEHSLVGTGLLVRFGLRRDRVRLVVWVAALGALTGYAVVALGTLYPTAAARQTRAALMGNPAAVMLGGPGFGRDHYTLGAMIANELGLTIMISAAVMSILLVVRHTRAEEETGRAELIRAGVVGPRAPLTAALALAALANAAIALVIAAGLTGAGLAATDSLAFGLGIGLTGLVFAGVAAVTAQISEHARTASGSALAVLGAAAVIRGIGDIAEPGGSPLSWFSPIAWAQQTRAYVDLRWWPLLVSLVVVAGLVPLGYLLNRRRDVGAGLVAPRRGPADASRLLSGATALTARLQRGTLVGWGIGLLITGLTFGTLTNAVITMLGDNPKLSRILAAGAGGQSLVDGFYAAMTIYVALGAAAFAVTSVLRQRGEETAGRGEAVLACAVGRLRWLSAELAVTAAGSALLLLAGGLGMGISAAAVTGDAGLVGALTGAALAHLPAVLVVAALAAALVGLAPRLAGLAWVVLGYAVFSGSFGALLGLPDWALHLSPLRWTPALPGAAFDLAPIAGLTALAAVLVAAGLAGIRRRDIG